jgi:glutathione S-transferase
MSTYKLYYFNFRGRGELIRLMLAQAGVQYEDFRFELDKWPAIKPTMPFLQVPVLEVDGVKISQTAAIGRYLADKFNMNGKTELDRARIHMIVECITDTLGTTLRSYKFAKDDAERKEVMRAYTEETLPPQLTALQKMLVENKGGDGFFVGDEPSWADVRFYHMYDTFRTMKVESILEKYPKLNALMQRVANLPRIKEWLAKRPQTEF